MTRPKTTRGLHGIVSRSAEEAATALTLVREHRAEYLRDDETRESMLAAATGLSWTATQLCNALKGA